MNAFFKLRFGVFHIFEYDFFDGDVARKTFDDLVAKFPDQRRDALLRAVESAGVPHESDEGKNGRKQLLALCGGAGIQRGARLFEDG